ELAARLLEHAPVGHAGRAHGLAGAGVEALVEGVDELVVGRDPALGEPAHQVDAAARGVRLDLELAIGGARGEAETAVDAGLVAGPAPRALGVEPASRG